MIFTSNKALLHKVPSGHPETTDRYLSAIKGVLEFPKEEARAALIDELLLVHEADYIELVEREIGEGRTLLSTGDVFLSPGSLLAALYAAGSALSSADYAIKNNSRAFSLMRPPGHHATGNRGMGFCLFNNIAIAARYLQKNYNLKRIAIIDFDLHHGNGTEEIFQNDSSILYFSTHESPLYPGTGLYSTDHILNFPIQAGADSRALILDIYTNLLPDNLKTFQPDFILISAGFDAHKLDPLGHLNLETDDFYIITDAIVKCAKELCFGRVVSILEGGYNLLALRESVNAHCQALFSN